MSDCQKDPDSIAAFDSLYTNNQIQKFKILLPYIDASCQKNCIILIKFMELLYTISYLNEHPLQICSDKPDINDHQTIINLCKELRRFSSGEEGQRLDNLKNMINTFHSASELSETLQMLQDILPPDMLASTFPGTDNNKSEDTSDIDNNNSSSGSMFDLLFQMLSPEQKSMFEMFQNNNPINENEMQPCDQKGDENHE